VLIYNVALLSYENQLKRLGLTRLDRRRDRSDLVEAYKITNSVYNVQSARFFGFDQSGLRDLSKNYLKETLSWMSGNFLVVEY